jgi:uncharacterized protein involved in type VI secretion and phage assembly
MTDAMQDLVDHLRGRHFGKYRGTVTEVEGSTMRLKAKVPAVLADVATGWCMPCVPYAGKDVGMMFLPEVGSGVWIEFEAGDVSYPVWVGCYWRSGELPDGASDKVKSLVTQSGTLSFDDDQGVVTLKDGNGNSHVLDSEGATVTGGSSKAFLSNDGVSVNDGALEVQ